MAHGACDVCGNSYAECECKEREKAKEEQRRQDREARVWEELGKSLQDPKH
jgi:hypothetical protein